MGFGGQKKPSGKVTQALVVGNDVCTHWRSMGQEHEQGFPASAQDPLCDDYK